LWWSQEGEKKKEVGKGIKWGKGIKLGGQKLKGERETGGVSLSSCVSGLAFTVVLSTIGGGIERGPGKAPWRGEVGKANKRGDPRGERKQQPMGGARRECLHGRSPGSVGKCVKKGGTWSWRGGKGEKTWGTTTPGPSERC